MPGPGGGTISQGAGGAKLLALTDAERRRLATAIGVALRPGVGGSGRSADLPPTYQVVRALGPPSGTGLADGVIESPKPDGTWQAVGSGKIRTSSTDRLLCRFAGEDAGSGQGVWEPVGSGTAGGAGCEWEFDVIAGIAAGAVTGCNVGIDVTVTTYRLKGDCTVESVSSSTTTLSVPIPTKTITYVTNVACVDDELDLTTDTAKVLDC